MKRKTDLLKLGLYIVLLSSIAPGCGLLRPAQVTPTTDIQPVINVLGINIDSAIVEAVLSDTLKMPLPPDINTDYSDQTDDLNFIRTWDVTKPVTDEEDITDADLQEAKQTTQYFDGLGRPVQTVAKGMSPNSNDMVSINTYDAFGRETYKFLPYTSLSNDGEFKTTPFAEQFEFLSNYYNPAQDENGERFFYSGIQYEASPLNRVLGAYAPGNSWMGAGIGTITRDLANREGDTVCIWNISSDIDAVPEYGGLYDPGQLYVKMVSDEQGSITLTYTNKSGQVILKRVFMDNTSPDIEEGDTNLEILLKLLTAGSQSLNTYYVYDDLDRLRFVLQPKATDWLRDNEWTFDEDSWEASAIAKELCFSYEYDGRGRMIVKRVPGADETGMVYDARDRLVMSQTKVSNFPVWLYTSYDELNRPVLTGLWTNQDDRETHQAEAENSTNYPDPGSGTDPYIPLSQTFYDNYDWVGATTLDDELITANIDNSDYFYEPDNNEFPYAQPVEANYQVRGMATGTVTDVLLGNATLYSVNFYDDRGRMIQTQSDNYSGGVDTVTMQYSFSGQVLRTLDAYRKGGNNPQSYRLATKIEYDDVGRLITTSKKVGNSPEVITAQNEYDELGQLKLKSLGQKVDAGNTSYYAYTSDPVDTLRYTYNVRGWLRGINKDYARNENSAENWFGEELCYDYGFDWLQLNGNIAGMRWRSKGDGEQRSYGFAYDMANRLVKADFRQYTNSSWNTDAGIDFSVDNITYDANGNILSMLQRGLKLGSSSLIDRLNYGYFENSNKLKYVMDTANDENSKLGDFKEHDNDDSQDYEYDAKGNLIQDNNKGISTIQYNHLNLPYSIEVTDKGTITYTYDAMGNKLQKVTVDNIDDTKTTTTDYIGPFVYQNDTLQFIGQEEGRIRPSTPGNLDTFYYDYFEKDHLGNVRVVLTDELKLDQYPALSFEGASGDEVTNQDNYWENSSGNSIDITSVRTTRPGNFGNSTTNGSYTMLVRKSTGSVGATKLLKVMSGDRIHVKLDYYYTATNSNNSTANGLNAFLSSIVSAITGSSSASPILKDGVDDVSTALGSNTAISGFFSPESSSTGGSNNPPKAYLHVLLFDERFNFDADHSFVQQVAYSPNTKGTIDKTLGNAVNVNKNGYAYIYFSNESDEMVYFDNFLLTHERGPLLEETHYYPFGLTMEGISSKALNFGTPNNKYKYNGIENNRDFDLNMYDAFFRNLDPQIGRFWQVDPLTTHSESPYVSMGNNPILNKDWLGNYFTWGNQTVEDTYKKLREENSKRISNYMNELAGLDLNSKDERVQKQIKQLTGLINSHGELNSQWNEMESSDVEFHVTNEMPSPGATGDATYNVDNKRVNIRLGTHEKNISSMAHEIRHGYGYLRGEMLGTKGADPLYDIMDEVVASNVGFLFLDRNTANLQADGYYNLDWFKNTQMGEKSLYKGLAGREEQLTTNTAAATYIKYNAGDRISFVLGFKNNANLSVQGAIDVLNANSQKYYNKPEYYTGTLLNNR